MAKHNIIVSVVIPTFNRKKKLKRLLNSLLEAYYAYPYFEIIVIDDASTDGTSEMVKKRFRRFEFLRLITFEKNQKVAAARNQGIKMAKGKYLFFVDDDVVIDKYTIPSLVNHCLEAKNKVLAAPLICELKDPKKIWFAGLKINFWTTGGSFLYQGEDRAIIERRNRIVSDGLVTSFLVPRKLIEKIGGFNKDLFPFGFEEIDFCIRAKLMGYSSIVFPKAVVFHDREKGAGLRDYWKLYLAARNRFVAHWLWSRNVFQQLAVSLFSLIYTFAYLVFFVRQNSGCSKRKAIRLAIKGVKDGIFLMRRVHPYRDSSRCALKCSF